MRKLDWISDAKIRASYGVTGNNRVGSFDYLSQLKLTNAAGYAWNNTLTQGAYPDKLGNSELKWESTRAFDAGVDLSFLKDRITLIADYYLKNTSDLLLNATLPASSGYTSAMLNIGSVRNEGVELTLNTVNIARKHFSWQSSFNIGLNRTTVTGLNDGEESFQTKVSWHQNFAGVPLYETRVGQPLTMFIGMKFDGLYQIEDFTWQNNSDPSIPHSEREYVLKDDVTDNGMARNQIQPGYIKFVDQDGDLHIDENDRVVIGNPAPLFSGGFSNSFKIYDFDVNVFFQFSYGNKIMNANRLIFEGTYRYGLNQFASYVDRWSPENPTSNNYVPGGGKVYYYSDKVLEDGSYLRLKTLSVGYNLPKKILKGSKVSAVRVYLAAQNLWTLTSYSGYDPEVSIYNSTLTPGLDYLSYPRAKTVTLGASVTF